MVVIGFFHCTSSGKLFTVRDRCICTDFSSCFYEFQHFFSSFMLCRFISSYLIHDYTFSFFLVCSEPVDLFLLANMKYISILIVNSWCVSWKICAAGKQKKMMYNFLKKKEIVILSSHTQHKANDGRIFGQKNTSTNLI